MITIKEIDEQIQGLKTEYVAIKNDDFDKEQKAKSRVQKKIDELKQIRLFIETNPTPEALLKHKEVLENKRNLIKDESNFEKWLIADTGRTNDIKKARTQYHKELDLGHVNAQLKTLNYILS